MITLWIFLIASLVFLVLRKKKISQYFLTLGIVFFCVVSLPFIPDLLVRHLENKYPPLVDITELKGNDTIYILVLGAGFDDNHSLPPNDQLKLNSLGRVIEAVRLHSLIKNSIIVVPGQVDTNKKVIPDSYISAAKALGVSDNSVFPYGYPKNTKMEARYFKNVFGNSKTLILVTDAVHIPRAIYLFQRENQNPIPAPTNHLIKLKKKIVLQDCLPDTYNLVKFELAIHEIAGLMLAKSGLI